MVQYVTLCEEEDSLCGPVCDRGVGGRGHLCGPVCNCNNSFKEKHSQIFEKASQCEQNPDLFSKCGSILFKYLS